MLPLPPGGSRQRQANDKSQLDPMPVTGLISQLLRDAESSDGVDKHVCATIDLAAKEVQSRGSIGIWRCASSTSAVSGKVLSPLEAFSRSRVLMFTDRPLVPSRLAPSDAMTRRGNLTLASSSLSRMSYPLLVWSVEHIHDFFAEKKESRVVASPRRFALVTFFLKVCPAVCLRSQPPLFFGRYSAGRRGNLDPGPTLTP